MAAHGKAADNVFLQPFLMPISGAMKQRAHSTVLPPLSATVFRDSSSYIIAKVERMYADQVITEIIKACAMDLTMFIYVAMYG